MAKIMPQLERRAAEPRPGSLHDLAMLDLAGFLAPFVIYAALLALHLLLPARRVDGSARRVDGYVRDPETDEPLRYRLNGLLV